MKFRLPQVYFSKITRAVVEFEMIERGDHILIGLSGGKDSLLLTYALAMLRERTKNKFSLSALTINPMFDAAFDTESLSRFCASLDIPHEIHDVDIAGVIRSEPKNAPCFTCAFFRRGAINRYAKEHGCNKVAYAHHNDDAVETLLLNLLYSGQIGTFQPKTYLDRSDLTVIRPLIYLREAETVEAVQYHGVTPVKSPCPIDGKTKRETVKRLLAELTENNPLVYDHLAAAMRKSDENGKNEICRLWPAAKSRQEMRESYDRFMRE